MTDALNLPPASTLSKHQKRTMKPSTDAEREALILELEQTNSELHKLRLKARELNDRLLELKNGGKIEMTKTSCILSTSSKPQVAPPKKSSFSTAKSSSPRTSKALSPDDEFWLGGVGD
jgi:hypothetical protein